MKRLLAWVVRSFAVEDRSLRFLVVLTVAGRPHSVASRAQR